MTFTTEKIKDAEVECLTSNCPKPLVASCETHLTAALDAVWTAAASAQRESDANALWRVLVSGKGNSFETVKFNPLVTLPKG